MAAIMAIRRAQTSQREAFPEKACDVAQQLARWEEWLNVMFLGPMIVVTLGISATPCTYHLSSTLFFPESPGCDMHNTRI